MLATTSSAQHRLVTEQFGIATLPLVLGWSMGAGQTYQWAVSHPEMVQRMLPFCGSSRTARTTRSSSTRSRLRSARRRGVRRGLVPRPDAWPVKGLRAFARVYAGWGFSQAFYWEEVWRGLGLHLAGGLPVGFWEGFFLDEPGPQQPAHDAGTWWNGDVGQTPGFRR